MATHGTVTAFDPSQEDWTSYAERLKHYFIANGVTDDDKKRAILISASGPATYKLLRSLVGVTRMGTDSYDALVKTLKDHYDPPPSFMLERYKFNCRDRAPEESITQYIAALRALAEHCEFGDALEEYLRDRLVFGINNESIRQRLLAEKDTSYKSIVALATALQTAAKGNKMIRNGDRSNNAGEGVHLLSGKRYKKPSSAHAGAGGGKPSNGEKPACYRCGGKHLATTCKFKTAECYFCKKRGHIAAACRTKARQGKAQPKSNHHLDANEGGSDSDTEPYSLFTVRNPSHEPMQVELTMNGVPVSMELDTGAAVSLINSSTYKRIAQASQVQQPLLKSKVTLKTYTGELINTLGRTTTLVRYGGKKETMEVHVVEGEGPNLLGRDWMTTFKGCVSCLCNVVSTNSADLDEMITKHAAVFSKELGSLQGFKAKLYVEPNATPKFHRPRPVPFALKKSVEAELQRLEDEGIISPVQFSSWAAPIVPVVKSNGKIRVCGDYKVTINQALQPDSYPLPRVDELFASLSGGRYFSKLDLSNAYLQIELEEESKQFVTINTSKGLFQYNRLPFGISSAPAIFQRCMETLLQGCKGVSVYLDDILISGATAEEHLQNLDKALSILETAGIKLNRDKCAFLLPKVEYLGHVIDEQGLHPTEEKVKAIKDAPRPKNVSELRAFLGIINYYGKFLPNLSAQLSPLHELLQKKARWRWSERQETAFQAAKHALQAHSLLVHYDGSKPLVLACDASPQGLGAVLSHIMPDGTERPVVYASRTLSQAEKNYSQVE